MGKTKEKSSTINLEKIPSFTHFVDLPFKLSACWEWYPKTEKESLMIFNNLYLAFVLFVLLDLVVALCVNFYIDWKDTMPSLEYIAESLPFIASVEAVIYCRMNLVEFYEMSDYINDHFQFHSARGLTNITMIRSYKLARMFQRVYMSSVMGSVVMYTAVPLCIHFWTGEPLSGWFYPEVTQPLAFFLSFLRALLAQYFMGLVLGQLAIYFAMNAILLCGQLELLCCSIRNARFTAILQHGVQHGALVRDFPKVMDDEEPHYFFNQSEMVDSVYHYDEKVPHASVNRSQFFDIYNTAYDSATEDALKDCARMHQMIGVYLKKIDNFISPLLVSRIAQVTLYLCTLLYGLSREFTMMGVEYIFIVTFDVFIYCYFGNQITLQANEVTLAAYQSFWHTMGVRPRKLLLNILVASKKPVTLRAWCLLPLDLQSFVTVMKTSFSCYTLLRNVNEQKG